MYTNTCTDVIRFNVKHSVPIEKYRKKLMVSIVTKQIDRLIFFEPIITTRITLWC